MLIPFKSFNPRKEFSITASKLLDLQSGGNSLPLTAPSPLPSPSTSEASEVSITFADPSDNHQPPQETASAPPLRPKRPLHFAHENDAVPHRPTSARKSKRESGEGDYEQVDEGTRSALKGKPLPAPPFPFGPDQIYHNQPVWPPVPSVAPLQPQPVEPTVEEEEEDPDYEPVAVAPSPARTVSRAHSEPQLALLSRQISSTSLAESNASLPLRLSSSQQSSPQRASLQLSSTFDHRLSPALSQINAPIEQIEPHTATNALPPAPLSSKNSASALAMDSEYSNSHTALDLSLSTRTDADAYANWEFAFTKGGKSAPPSLAGPAVEQRSSEPPKVANVDIGARPEQFSQSNSCPPIARLAEVVAAPAASRPAALSPSLAPSAPSAAAALSPRAPAPLSLGANEQQPTSPPSLRSPSRGRRVLLAIQPSVTTAASPAASAAPGPSPAADALQVLLSAPSPPAAAASAEAAKSRTTASASAKVSPTFAGAVRLPAAELNAPPVVARKVKQLQKTQSASQESVERSSLPSVSVPSFAPEVERFERILRRFRGDRHSFVYFAPKDTLSKVPPIPIPPPDNFATLNGSLSSIDMLPPPPPPPLSKTSSSSMDSSSPKPPRVVLLPPQPARITTPASPRDRSRSADSTGSERELEISDAAARSPSGATPQKKLRKRSVDAARVSQTSLNSATSATTDEEFAWPAPPVPSSRTSLASPLPDAAGARPPAPLSPLQVAPPALPPKTLASPAGVKLDTHQSRRDPPAVPPKPLASARAKLLSSRSSSSLPPSATLPPKKPLLQQSQSEQLLLLPTLPPSAIKLPEPQSPLARPKRPGSKSVTFNEEPVIHVETLPEPINYRLLLAHVPSFFERPPAAQPPVPAAEPSAPVPPPPSFSNPTPAAPKLVTPPPEFSTAVLPPPVAQRPRNQLLGSPAIITPAPAISNASSPQHHVVLAPPIQFETVPLTIAPPKLPSLSSGVYDTIHSAGSVPKSSASASVSSSAAAAAAAAAPTAKRPPKLAPKPKLASKSPAPPPQPSPPAPVSSPDVPVVGVGLHPHPLPSQEQRVPSKPTVLNYVELDTASLSGVPKSSSGSAHSPRSAPMPPPKPPLPQLQPPEARPTVEAPLVTSSTSSAAVPLALSPATPPPPPPPPPALLAPTSPFSDMAPVCSSSRSGAGAAADMLARVTASRSGKPPVPLPLPLVESGGGGGSSSRAATPSKPAEGAARPPPTSVVKPFRKADDAALKSAPIQPPTTFMDAQLPSTTEPGEKTARLHQITENVVQMDRTIEQFASDLERIDRTLSEISTYNKRFMSAVEALPDADADAAADGQQGQALDVILDSVQQIHALQQRQSALVTTRIGQLGSSSAASPNSPEPSSAPPPPPPPPPHAPPPAPVPLTEHLLMRTAFRPGAPVPASPPAQAGPAFPHSPPAVREPSANSSSQMEPAETNIDAESLADSTLTSSLPKTKSASQTDLDQVVRLTEQEPVRLPEPTPPPPEVPALGEEVVLRHSRLRAARPASKSASGEAHLERPSVGAKPEEPPPPLPAPRPERPAADKTSERPNSGPTYQNFKRASSDIESYENQPVPARMRPLPPVPSEGQAASAEPTSPRPKQTLSPKEGSANDKSKENPEEPVSKSAKGEGAAPPPLPPKPSSRRLSNPTTAPPPASARNRSPDEYEHISSSSSSLFERESLLIERRKSPRDAASAPRRSRRRDSGGEESVEAEGEAAGDNIDDVEENGSTSELAEQEDRARLVRRSYAQTETKRRSRHLRETRSDPNEAMTARRSARTESRNLQDDEQSIVQRLRLLADVLANGGEAPDVIADTFRRSRSDRNLLTKRRGDAATAEELTARRSSFRQSMRMQQQLEPSPQHQSTTRERQQQLQHRSLRLGERRQGSTRRSHRAAPDTKESKPLPARPAAAEPPIPARQPNLPSAVPHRPYLSNLVVYQNAYNITLGDAAPPDGKPRNGFNTPPLEPTSPRPAELDFYQNNDSAAGRTGEAAISARKEATVAAGNKRASAHIDEELGIEDEDYNANYDEEEVAPERPASGERAGEDVDEEDSEAQEAHLSRSRSNRQSSFRRSRSADIARQSMLHKSMLEATEMRELRGKTTEELERLVLDYLDQQKILKLRQLLGAMRDGSAGPEAIDPRMVDVLRKYERRINSLITARARPGSRLKSNGEEDLESNFSSVSQQNRGGGLQLPAGDSDTPSGVSGSTMGMAFPFAATTGGERTGRFELPADADAVTCRHHPPAFPMNTLAQSVRVLRLGPRDYEIPPPPLKPVQKPRPPDTARAAVFENVARFEDIDKHAIEVAQENEWLTWRSLTDELCRMCVDEIERVRVFFRWISTKNLALIDVEPSVAPESFLGILRAVKYGVRSYHDLFKRLCIYAGIHCEIIHGYSKGAGYTPGTSIKDNRMFRNMWTAVYVCGSWRFVNVCWGARYLLRSYTLAARAGTGADLAATQMQLAATASPNLNLATLLANTSNGLPVFKCDNFYFLTDPEKHIFEHLPDKKVWQLLRNPITIDDFMRLPILKSNMFNAGLELKKRYTETLDTREGRVQVLLHMPKYVGACAMLLAREDMSEIRGLTLVRFMDEYVVVCAEPPKVGRFFLNIYVNEDWRQDAFQAQGGISGGYELACSFQIRCVGANLDRLVLGRFPPNLGALGKTPIADKLGIMPARGFGDPYIVDTRGGELRADMHMLPGLKVQHQMTYFERSGKQMQQCDAYALLQSRNRVASYWLRCPADGFYLLTVYASELVPGSRAADDELECAFRFLVDSRKPSGKLPSFPRQSSRFAGCYLHEPTQRLLHVQTKYLFRIESAPNLCQCMSLVINGKTWIDLKPESKAFTLWSARVSTGDELGELSVYAKMRADQQSGQKQPSTAAPSPSPGAEPEERYVKLLDYELVAKPKQM